MDSLRSWAPRLVAAAWLLLVAHVVSGVGQYLLFDDAADFGGRSVVYERLAASFVGPAFGWMLVVAAGFLLAARAIDPRSSAIGVPAVVTAVFAAAVVVLGVFGMVQASGRDADAIRFEVASGIVVALTAAFLALTAAPSRGHVDPDQHHVPPPSPFGRPDPRRTHEPHLPFGPSSSSPEWK